MFHRLFSPFRTGSNTFRNRMFITGHVTMMVSDCMPKAFLNTFARRAAIQDLWRKAMGEVHV